MPSLDEIGQAFGNLVQNVLHSISNNASDNGVVGTFHGTPLTQEQLGDPHSLATNPYLDAAPATDSPEAPSDLRVQYGAPPPYPSSTFDRVGNMENNLLSPIRSLFNIPDPDSKIFWGPPPTAPYPNLQISGSFGATPPPIPNGLSGNDPSYSLAPVSVVPTYRPQIIAPGSPGSSIGFSRANAEIYTPPKISGDITGADNGY